MNLKRIGTFWYFSKLSNSLHNHYNYSDNKIILLHNQNLHVMFVNAWSWNLCMAKPELWAILRKHQSSMIHWYLAHKSSNFFRLFQKSYYEFCLTFVVFSKTFEPNWENGVYETYLTNFARIFLFFVLVNFFPSEPS